MDLDGLDTLWEVVLDAAGDGCVCMASVRNVSVDCFWPVYSKESNTAVFSDGGSICSCFFIPSLARHSRTVKFE